MSYLHYLCLFAYSGVQHILCCGFFPYCVPYVASFSGSSPLIAPMVFSNVCLLHTLWFNTFTGRAAVSSTFVTYVTTI